MKGIRKIKVFSDQDKLTDRAFKQSITISVLGILFCMIALCSTTFAWFNASVSSTTNSIKAANCSVTVSVVSDGSSVDAVGGSTYTFEAGQVYTITITASGTSETAYCILNIDEYEYYTEQIPTSTTAINGETVSNNISFYMKFTKDTKVEIITRWGYSSQDDRKLEDGLFYKDLTVISSATIEAEGSGEIGVPSSEERE